MEKRPPILFPLVVFLSAFLLFQVQPMIGKVILPTYGGAPAVWTACLLFLQIALLLGYAYAHFIVIRLGEQARFRVHIACLVLVVLSLPLAGSGGALLSPTNSQVFAILVYLAGSLGPSYVALAATSPLLQGVLSRRGEGDAIYRLYAVSNVGSFGALLLYPLVIEPHSGVSNQLIWWSAAFLLFALLIALTLWPSAAGRIPAPQSPEAPGASCSLREVCLWGLLAAAGCLLLLAETSHISQDIAAVPLLWVVPLAVYLLTYVLAFSGRGWVHHSGWGIGFLALLGLVLAVAAARTPVAVEYRLLLELALLFWGCMVCHGELARMRPSTDQVTRFFLVTSFGSVLAGVFVAIIGPIIFHEYSERSLGLTLVGVTAAVAVTRGGFTKLSMPALAGVVALCAVVAIVADRVRTPLVSRRSFFGVVQVSEKNADAPAYHLYKMHHGAVVHGLQFRDPAKRKIPTSYYGEGSGVGLVLRNFRVGKQRRIGAIGLGVGTIAAYGTPTDHFRFYEINSDVVELARSHFAFLEDSSAVSEVVVGDARIVLTTEAPNSFDVMVIDAFSGDAIPTHLITREALQVYLRHLRDDGILVFHVSNQYLNIASVVVRLGEDAGLTSYLVEDPGVTVHAQTASSYVLLPRRPFSPGLLAANPSIRPVTGASFGAEESRVWTDDYSDLISLLRSTPVATRETHPVPSVDGEAR